MTRMKDSGIEWIGEIPEEWQVRKFKSFAYCRMGETILGEDLTESGIPVYSATLSDNVFGYVKESKINLTYGDLVIPARGNSIGNLTIVNYEMATCTQTTICCKLNRINKNFTYYYCLGLKDYLFEYDNTAIPQITVRQVESNPIVYPGLPVQRQIADYLDCKCMLIDSIIEKQKSVIGKLKLYKQSVITEAVTKGLDPTVKMKTSGIKWIGEIPEKWEVGQLKFFGTIHSGITLGKKYSPGTKLVEYPYLRVANVQGGYTDLTDVSTILITEDEAQKHKLQVGEVLMTEGGDRDKLGRGCIWYGEIENCLHQNHVFAVRTEESKLNAKFFDYITTSDVGRNYFDFTAKKTTNLASTNSTTILEFRFPVPHIDEQKEIISYLDTKCSQIDAIITGKQSLINKLTDYKKSLIYECVTGKREVM